MTSSQNVEEIRGAFITSDHNSSESTSNQTSLDQSHWRIWGKRLPKQEVVFFAQICIIYIVIIVSIVNLTLKCGEEKVWIAFIGSSLGYLLPNPHIKVQQTSK